MKLHRSARLAVLGFLGCGTASTQLGGERDPAPASSNPADDGAERATLDATRDAAGAPDGAAAERDAASREGGGDASSTNDAPVPLHDGGPALATALAAGAGFTCALTQTGTVKCWGYNGTGQLGLGAFDWTPHPTPEDVPLGGPAQAIAAAGNYACAIMATRTVKCWGANDFGQLGDGTTAHRAWPADVIGLSDVKALALGAYHACALSTAGAVRCWGHNTNGALGDGTTLARTTPVTTSGLGGGVVDIVAGEFHTCARLAAGPAKCWGPNQSGELGDGTLTMRNAPVLLAGLPGGVAGIAAGYAFTCAISSVSNGLACIGLNSHGQLGDGTTTDRTTLAAVTALPSAVLQVRASNFRACALKLGGVLLCWGENGSGELGDETTANRTTPVAVAALPSPIVEVALGGNHTCARSQSGSVWCWGENFEGQVGDGTLIERHAPAAVVGF